MKRVQQWQGGSNDFLLFPRSLFAEVVRKLSDSQVDLESKLNWKWRQFGSWLNKPANHISINWSRRLIDLAQVDSLVFEQLQATSSNKLSSTQFCWQSSGTFSTLGSISQQLIEHDQQVKETPFWKPFLKIGFDKMSLSSLLWCKCIEGTKRVSCTRCFNSIQFKVE